jgi:hypothetical protein
MTWPILFLLEEYKFKDGGIIEFTNFETETGLVVILD